MSENTSLGVYVTGAATGLGRAVVRQLVARGYTVTGTAVTMADANAIRQDGGLPVYDDLLRSGAILSTLKMTKATLIVNTAPQVINTLPFHKPDWDYYQKLLIDGSAALADAAAQAGVQFVVHASYAFLYGDTHGEWADESHALDTSNPLFAAAAQAEKTLLNSGVPVCVLRAGYNYGPGNQSIETLHERLINRGVVNVSEDVASWVQINDLADALVLALEKQPAGEVFNIADDEPVSPMHFVKQFADNLSVSHPGKLPLPFNLGELVLPAAERALLDVSVKASAAKAKEQLGWGPQYTSMTAGIEQMLLAWRAAESVQV
ncbi:MAG: hypothetical protein CL610_23285 [Anaerolineaceae bacterium]|nr:hypothetical protein [Anaerolineaceae bacterium]